MKKRHLITASLLLSLPVSAPALQVIDEKLEIYGKLNVAIAGFDPDASGEGTDFVVSSNSSRLGFKGIYGLNERFSVLYQIEQGVDLTDSSDDFWSTRNSFVGLRGPMGDVLVGYHDTPFKQLRGKFLTFGDTVGDHRALIGASAQFGSKMDTRGKNALYWRKSFFEQLQLGAMYSADQQNNGSRDDNDHDMYSVSALWTPGNFSLGLAYEEYSALDIDKAVATEGDKVSGYRLGAGYDFGRVRVGALYEDYDAGDAGESTYTLNRAAYGAHVALKLTGKATLKAQWLHAEDYGNVDDSSADMYAVGGEYKIHPSTTVYAVYTQTRNGEAARYQGVDGGHGDELKTTLGGDPRAIALGLIWIF
ncbi:porin [Alkalilimnicola sp. S0819]|uniref:porin n=1 Tax=Alkalilimnicola sp. S0819 TaxID=2613922 RepID=UPI001262955A|nr:porin [Alkalilimnicola sp. S0819]KAB7623173.1 porin [Alkalilimnicola sp. S0819]MPQ17017.1 porin [Alkalilimnicola sp. S0819]